MCETQPTTVAGPKSVFDVPHSARVWNYWLGGKDHYPLDRVAAHAWQSQYPSIGRSVRQSRAFLTRAVCHLARSGVRQFLDIGTGLPFAPYLHDILQEVVTGSRVVYVDYDPLVLAHARAVLVSDTTTGSSGVLDADLRQPDQLITNAVLDRRAPVAVILSHVLGHLTHPREAHHILAQLIEAVGPGSYLILGEATDTSPAPRPTTHAGAGGGGGGQPYRLYSPYQLAELVQDLELIPPGLVAVNRWRPGRLDITDPAPCDAYGVLARTPRRGRATRRRAPEGSGDRPAWGDPRVDRHPRAMPTAQAQAELA